MQIGEKIKNYRKIAGLTQEQVADYLDEIGRAHV